MRKVYTQTQKQQAIDMYRKGVPIREIEAQTGVANTVVSKYAIEAGCEPRRHTNRNKKCPNCRQLVKLGGAKYCPYCGKDLRSEKELLIEKTQRLFEMLQPLPSGDKDEARDIINEILKYIKG